MLTFNNDDGQKTALMIAAEIGQGQSSNVLLDTGAAIDLPSVTLCERKRGRSEVVKMLMEYGACIR